MKKIKEIIERERAKTLHCFRVCLCILCYISSWHLIIQSLTSPTILVSAVSAIGMIAFWRAGGLFLRQIINK